MRAEDHQHIREAETAAAVVADIATAAATPSKLATGVVHHVVVPDGYGSVLHDLRVLNPEFDAAPARAIGTHRPHTLDSFVALTDRHKSEHTTIWIDRDGPSVTAVLNDHGSGASAQWGDHRVRLALSHTPEWRHWTSLDGQYVGQERFVEHVQDGLKEIREPDGATMLEIAQTMQGKTKVDWKSARRVDNGEVSFVYQEEIEAGAGRQGHLEIPERLVLSIAPFVGEPLYELTARLRYRIKEGNLAIGYKLDRPHEIVDRVLDDIADRLSESGFANVYSGAAR